MTIIKRIISLTTTVVVLSSSLVFSAAENDCRKNTLAVNSAFDKDPRNNDWVGDLSKYVEASDPPAKLSWLRIPVRHSGDFEWCFTGKVKQQPRRSGLPVRKRRRIGTLLEVKEIMINNPRTRIVEELMFDNNLFRLYSDKNIDAYIPISSFVYLLANALENALLRAREMGLSPDIRNLPEEQLFIALLEKSTHFAEDHTGNGFIGIHRHALAKYSWIKRKVDQEQADSYLQLLLEHELIHELTGIGDEIEALLVLEDMKQLSLADDRVQDLLLPHKRGISTHFRSIRKVYEGDSSIGINLRDFQGKNIFLGNVFRTAAGVYRYEHLEMYHNLRLERGKIYIIGRNPEWIPEITEPITIASPNPALARHTLALYVTASGRLQVIDLQHREKQSKLEVEPLLRSSKDDFEKVDTASSLIHSCRRKLVESGIDAAVSDDDVCCDSSLLNGVRYELRLHTVHNPVFGIVISREDDGERRQLFMTPSGNTVQLPPAGGWLLVGRNNKSDVILAPADFGVMFREDWRYLSRVHCAVRFDPVSKNLQVVNLSANGTKVNMVLINARAENLSELLLRGREMELEPGTYIVGDESSKKQMVFYGRNGRPVSLELRKHGLLKLDDGSYLVDTGILEVTKVRRRKSPDDLGTVKIESDMRGSTIEINLREIPLDETGRAVVTMPFKKDQMGGKMCQGEEISWDMDYSYMQVKYNQLYLLPWIERAEQIGRTVKDEDRKYEEIKKLVRRALPRTLKKARGRKRAIVMVDDFSDQVLPGDHVPMGFFLVNSDRSGGLGGAGVCRHYAFLFEKLAEHAGLTGVSTRIGRGWRERHAWNYKDFSDGRLVELDIFNDRETPLVVHKENGEQRAEGGLFEETEMTIHPRLTKSGVHISYAADPRQPLYTMVLDGLAGSIVNVQLTLRLRRTLLDSEGNYRLYYDAQTGAFSYERLAADGSAANDEDTLIAGNLEETDPIKERKGILNSLAGLLVRPIRASAPIHALEQSI